MYVFLVVCVLLLSGCMANGSAPDDPGWVLTFAEEGDGEAGGAPAAERWVTEVGGGGWGNNEFQTYTAGNGNAFYDGQGNLVIEARRETVTGPDGVRRDYTSARLITKGRFEQRYGRFEARIQIPRGQGVWPAFWMLGASFPEVGWPGCGEIDIMENIGRELDKVHGTLHGPGYSASDGLAGTYEHPDGGAFADGFHVYAVEWDASGIRWFVDGVQYHERTPADVGGAGEGRWVFDDGPFFLLLNVAVGGYWPGYPDETTPLPQRMVVDYVRVYRRAE
ncbi:MAG: glycoside hydrolase family 16 protein [Planctomycetota bacterium]